jgi:hypothetical protein
METNTIPPKLSLLSITSHIGFGFNKSSDRLYLFIQVKSFELKCLLKVPKRNRLTFISHFRSDTLSVKGNPSRHANGEILEEEKLPTIAHAVAPVIQQKLAVQLIKDFVSLVFLYDLHPLQSNQKLFQAPYESTREIL